MPLLNNPMQRGSIGSSTASRFNPRLVPGFNNQPMQQGMAGPSPMALQQMLQMPPQANAMATAMPQQSMPPNQSIFTNNTLTPQPMPQEQQLQPRNRFNVDPSNFRFGR